MLKKKKKTKKIKLLNMMVRKFLIIIIIIIIIVVIVVVIFLLPTYFSLVDKAIEPTFFSKHLMNIRKIENTRDEEAMCKIPLC